MERNKEIATSANLADSLTEQQVMYLNGPLT